MTDLPTPDYANNMKLLGYSDQGGRPDGVQIMVNKGHAIIGHMFSDGFSVVDCTDPRAPKAVAYIPAPPNTWNIHLQSHEDLLLVINAKNMFASAEFQNEEEYYKGKLGKKVGTADAASTGRNWTAGMAVYDISNPAAPKKIGFMDVEGGGVHRLQHRALPPRLLQAPDAVLDHDHRAVDDQSEIDRPEAHQVTGHARAYHSDEREQH